MQHCCLLNTKLWKNSLRPSAGLIQTGVRSPLVHIRTNIIRTNQIVTCVAGCEESEFRCWSFPSLSVSPLHPSLTGKPIMLLKLSLVKFSLLWRTSNGDIFSRHKKLARARARSRTPSYNKGLERNPNNVNQGPTFNLFRCLPLPSFRSLQPHFQNAVE